MPAEQKEVIFAVFVASFIFFILAVLVILLLYNYFRVRIQREKEILKTVFQTQESEQNRISEDLHDDIGGKLSALKLQNELLYTEQINESTQELVFQNATLIDTIVKDIRNIVRNQSSKYLLQNGLRSELSSLFDQYKTLKGINGELKFLITELHLLPDFQITIFRVLQELLHNSVKHSKASIIKLSITNTTNKLEVNYSDNGKGFENLCPENAGMGLKNIKTRVQLYHGQIQFTIVPYIATTFRIQFELAAVTGNK
jgi:signal transduction histidine kinase